MAGLITSSKILDKYFGYLKNLDVKSKRLLIEKLRKSINPNPKRKFDISSLYGAWVDDRSPDEIIEDIKTSRVEKPDSESFQ
jgi:hypothetical protein